MSENIDGALAFKATLDINDFNISSEAMERRIISVSDTAVQESARMEQSILNFAQNGARYIVSYLVGNGMMSLVNSIVQTRGQFQQLEIAFGTMLGNEQKAKALMDQMVDTAAKTPFDLMGVAGGAKQLLAYGTAADKVNDTLVRLGNIASGLSIPLNDIVYLYGTTMVQGRLYAQDVRQFTGRGIPLVKELAAMYGKTAEEINTMVSEGKIGFPEVEKVLNKLTNAGGQFYNLMEKQSSSLTGMIANLGDAWDTALNKLGEDNQDVFASGISGATYLVENFDEILRIVKAITIAYGSYKAAIVLNALVTKGYTGVALLDNTVRQAKIALLKTDAKLTGETAAITKKMEEAEKSYIATLQAKISLEQHEQALHKIKVDAVNDLLTADQKRYLSNKGLTSSSQEYLKEAESVLSVEQKNSLAKQKLSTNSRAYADAIEILAKKNDDHINSLQSEAKELNQKIAFVNQSKSEILSEVEAARYEVYWSKQGNDVRRIENAERRLSIANKRLASVATDANAMSARKEKIEKELSTLATKKSTAAGVVDVVSKTSQTVSTNILTAATNRLKLAFSALWQSMKSNPIGWILTGIGLLISAFTYFTSSQDDAIGAGKEFDDTVKKEIDNLNMLKEVLKNTEAGTKAHKQALEKLNAILQDYNKELVTESTTVQELKGKYDELTIAINESAAARIKAKYIEQIQSDKEEKQNEATGDFKKDIRNTTRVSSKKTIFGDFMSYDDVEGLKNLSDATFDLIEAYVKTQAEELKKLSGDEYKKAVKQVEQTITKILKDASKEDFTGVYFLDKISGYINKIAQPAKEAEGAMEKLNEQVNAGRDAMNGVKDAVPIDYLKMSFSDLDKLVQDTQTEIDTINAKKLKVETDNTRLTELRGIIGQVKTAISTKETNLNTESDINARIKQLQDERANVDVNSKKYRELTATITGLQKKLPDNSKNAGENAIRKQEQLAEKQLQVDMKLEQARIDIMDDGYEKRKAVLDLQHKKNLADIDKEEKELSKVRKEAGKGGLSSSEKKGFDNRRNLENQSYTKDQNKLFDGEIEYKKSQYQLYFRWVQNMGEDVANAQFSKLLQGGSSYKEYVEKQISDLKAKQASGSALSEGESNQLITLNMQYDEITGAKSAMDQFKESVTRTISQAQTLAEKLQAVADARAKLDNGETGLVGADEKAEASLFISQEEEKNQQEIQDQLLNNYRTYEEHKKSIQDQYALLRSQAQKMNDQERLNQVNKGEAEALSALNAQMLMQSESWKSLFTDLDSLSAGEISQLLSDIENQLKNADLKLSPVDMKALTDSLNKARDELVQKNPFKAIGKFYDDYVKAKKKLAEAKNKVNNGTGTDKDVKEAESEVKKASAGVFKSIGVVTDAATECGNSLASMFDALGMGDAAEGLGTAIELMGQLGNAAQGVGKLMSGDIIGGITGIVSSVSSVVGIFANLHDSKYEKKIQNIQKEIDALERGYSRLERAYNNTYWTFSDSQRDSYEKNINLIENQISALQKQADVAKKSWNFVKYAQLTKQIKELKYALEKEEGKGDMFQLYELQKQSLREQQELIKQQIAAEKDKKKTDNDKIAEWEEAIKDIDTQLEDMERQMMETLAGTDVKSAIDEFADAMVDAYLQGENAAEALGKKTKEVLKNAIVEALKRNYLAKGIEEAVKYLGSEDVWKDNMIDEREQAEFERLVKLAGDNFNKYLGALDGFIDKTEETPEDPLTGAVRGMSEETGSVVAGRLNAFVINQSDQNSLLRQSLIYQQEIAYNTRYCKNLEDIAASLKRIENKDSSLLSQGIA